jgi:hypothetical protein
MYVLPDRLETVIRNIGVTTRIGVLWEKNLKIIIEENCRLNRRAGFL